MLTEEKIKEKIEGAKKLAELVAPGDSSVYGAILTAALIEPTQVQTTKIESGKEDKTVERDTKVEIPGEFAQFLVPSKGTFIMVKKLTGTTRSIQRDASLIWAFFLKKTGQKITSQRISKLVGDQYNNKRMDAALTDLKKAGFLTGVRMSQELVLTDDGAQHAQKIVAKLTGV